MNFTPTFLNTLAELRDGSAESKVLAGEIDLGKSKIGELFEAERVAQAAADNLLPSELIAFDSKVADVFTQLRKAQLIRAGVTVAGAKLETRQANLTAKLRRGLAEAEPELQRLATAQGMVSVVTIPGIGCATQIKELETLTEYHGDLLGKVDVLLSICRQLGAKIPEAKP